jgi:hypothetical protein
MADRNDQTQTHRFGFPKSNLLEATRDLGNYVLIADDGRVWTSANDKSGVQDIVQKAGVTPEMSDR